MFIRIKNIQLKNIKVHKELNLMDLPENGLITIGGSNSNGKSSLVGFLIDVFKCNFKTNKKCEKHISYWANEATALIEGHCGTKVLVRLTKEASNSTYTIVMPGKNPITMCVKDPTLENITKVIFNIDPDKDSINFFSLHKSKLLGVNTSPQETFRIFEKYVTDSYVKQSVEYLSDFIKQSREALKYVEMQIKSREEVVNETYGDIDMMKETLSKLTPIRDVEQMANRLNQIPRFELNVDYNLSYEDEELLLLSQRDPIPQIQVRTLNLSIPRSIYEGAMVEMPEIVNVVNFTSIDIPEIEYIEEPEVIGSEMELLEDYWKADDSLQQLLDKKCPTCGKTIHEEGVCS